MKGTFINIIHFIDIYRIIMDTIYTKYVSHNYLCMNKKNEHEIKVS